MRGRLSSVLPGAKVKVSRVSVSRQSISFSIASLYGRTWLTTILRAPTERASRSRCLTSRRFVLYDDKGDADLDLMSVPAVPPGQAFDVFHDAAQAGSGPDRLEALFGRSVEGDPEHVEAFPQQSLDQGVVQERRVGRHLDAEAESFYGTDHVEDPWVGRGFAESAEHDRLEVGKPPELTNEEAESPWFISPIGSFQVFRIQVLQARLQREVGSIEAVQAVDVGQDSGSPSLDGHLQGAPGSRPSFFSRFRRKNELAFLNEQLINGLACGSLAPQ